MLVRGLISFLTLLTALISINAQASNWLTEAQLHAAQGQDAQALLTLWNGLSQTTDNQLQENTALLLTAELYSRNGLVELARGLYLRLNQPINKLHSGDRYAVARFFATQQEWQRLIQTLQPHWQTFPQPLKQKARNLLGLGYLKLQKPETAAKLLRQRRHHSAPNVFQHYNLAVANHQMGRSFEARQALHELLLRKTFSAEQKLFQEHVRIRLAQHYLHHEQGTFATPLLQDVSSNSPYANRALLLLGWAALTPGGTNPACQSLAASRGCWIEVDANGHDVHRSQHSISQTFAGIRQQQKSRNEHKRPQGLQQAITSWTLLADKPRHPQGPFATAERLAQLEAMVSLGYALQASGSNQTALTRYQQALKALEASHPSPLAMSSAVSAIHKLKNLQQEIQQLVTQGALTSPELIAKAEHAINNALNYRQSELETERVDQQGHWRQQLLEYKKQALLGLASLHEQMSHL